VATAQTVEPSVGVGEVWLHEGELHVSILCEGILDEEARRMIDQGGTAEIVYTIELIRKRSGWFDSSVGDPTIVPFQISYEPFERKYRMLGEDIRLKDEDFQRVADQVTNLRDIGLGSLAEFGVDMNANYYVVVTVQFQPITMETLDELRSWMGSDQPATEDQPRSGGVGSRIAQALMSAAGFGERQLRGESETFQPSQLPER
jgi:hypothetical protein